jgi:hypothetical protein
MLEFNDREKAVVELEGDSVLQIVRGDRGHESSLGLRVRMRQ